MVIIRGGSLTGLAAAARLARLGHQVTLVTGGGPLGGRWAARPGPAGELVDDLSPTIALPAAWRDLFKKTGAHLVTALNGAGLELVPAPPATHLLPDGTTLELPAQRGSQHRVIAAAFGEAEAVRWRIIGEELDRYWMAFRAHALEGIEPVKTAAQRRVLGLTRTVGELADQLTSPLSAVLLGMAPNADAPALTALPLAVERTFGRWQLVDGDHQPRRVSTLIDLLVARARQLGVRVVAELDDHPHIDCRALGPSRSWFQASAQPLRRPRISWRLGPADGTTEAREVFDHRGGTRTWTRPVNDATLIATVEPGAGEPDPSWGLALRRPKDWASRVPIVGDPLRASACSPAGAEPWAELGSAALAVYELHQRLTGQDCRPTNINFKPPRR